MFALLSPSGSMATAVALWSYVSIFYFEKQVSIVSPSHLLFWLIRVCLPFAELWEQLGSEFISVQSPDAWRLAPPL